MQLFTLQHLYNSKEYSVDFRFLKWSFDELFLIESIEPLFDGINVPFYYSKTGAPSQKRIGPEDFHKHLFKVLFDGQPYN